MIHLLTKMKRIVDYKIPKKAVVFLSRKSRIVASSVLLLMTILLFSRCDYSTKVISSAEPPDTVFNTFFDALKEKDFVKADACLANGATISPQNETDYEFFDTYVNTSLDLLRCESVGEPVYNGMNASVDVRLVSIDSKTFVSWMEKNYLNIEHDYLKNKKIAEIANEVGAKGKDANNEQGEEDGNDGTQARRPVPVDVCPRFAEGIAKVRGHHRSHNLLSLGRAPRGRPQAQLRAGAWSRPFRGRALP